MASFHQTNQLLSLMSETVLVFQNKIVLWLVGLCDVVLGEFFKSLKFFNFFFCGTIVHFSP